MLPPAVQFAITPALAITGLLDHTKGDHVKIFTGAIKAVSDEQFNCEAEGLYQFLKDVLDRADEMSCTQGILKVNREEDDQDDDEAPKVDNLIDNYGTLTLEEVVESEAQYIE
jgi:hypothetical protein